MSFIQDTYSSHTSRILLLHGVPGSCCYIRECCINRLKKLDILPKSVIFLESGMTLKLTKIGKALKGIKQTISYTFVNPTKRPKQFLVGFFCS